MKKYAKMNDVVIMSSEVHKQMMEDIKKSEVNKTYASLLTAGVLLYGIYKFVKKQEEEVEYNDY